VQHTNSIIIHKASVADIPLIKKLVLEVWPSTYVPIIGEEQVAYMLQKFYNTDTLTQQMQQQAHQFIIGYNGDTPVAFAAYAPLHDSVWKLHKLYILPQQQGMGIGKHMVNYIKTDVKKNNATSLILNVNIHNAAAIAFYNKYGFSHLRDEDIDIGEGYYMNDHVYTLAL
jgi:ribosomal protein S18 acetylase RimI-like enzyme